MKDRLEWRAVVTCDGHEVGGQTNWWCALPDEEYERVQEEGKKYLAFAVTPGNQDGPYAIEFTDIITENGTTTTSEPLLVEGMTFKSVNNYMRKAQKLSDFMIDWAEDDEKHGKPTAWDHTKAKPHKPQPK